MILVIYSLKQVSRENDNKLHNSIHQVISRHSAKLFTYVKDDTCNLFVVLFI